MTSVRFGNGFLLLLGAAALAAASKKSSGSGSSGSYEERKANREAAEKAGQYGRSDAENARIAKEAKKNYY